MNISIENKQTTALLTAYMQFFISRMSANQGIKKILWSFSLDMKIVCKTWQFLWKKLYKEKFLFQIKTRKNMGSVWIHAGNSFKIFLNGILIVENFKVEISFVTIFIWRNLVEILQNFIIYNGAIIIERWNFFKSKVSIFPW